MKRSRTTRTKYLAYAAGGLTKSRSEQIATSAKLGLQPGDALEARVEGQHIVLSPRKVRSRKARIIRDPVTGLPILTAGPKAPKLTSVEVRELLADFP